VIHLFASQNLPPSTQPKADKDLAPTQEPPPPSGLCVTPSSGIRLRLVHPSEARTSSSAPHRAEPVNPPPSTPPVSSPRWPVTATLGVSRSAMPQTWGLTRVSQGAAFAPRGGCPLGPGLSPGLPAERELPPRVVTACSILRRLLCACLSVSASLRGIAFLQCPGTIGSGNDSLAPPRPPPNPFCGKLEDTLHV
jgi:hypothetical protein